MLILAAVSIATLTGENGLLSKTNEAKIANDKAGVKEQAQLDILNWQAEQLKNGEDDTLTDSIIKSILTGKDYVGSVGESSFTTAKGGYEIPYSELYSTTPGGETVTPGEIVKVTTKNNYTDGTDSATIPAGFTVSNIPSEQNISTGLVIYDIPEEDLEEGVGWTTPNADGTYQVQTLYNQFVWIPVASADLYERDFSYPSYYYIDGSWANSETTPAGSTYTDISYLPDEIQPETDEAEANEVAERASVIKYNGFYIARYEAGDSNVSAARSSTTDGVLVSKQNVWVYNYVTQTNSKTKAKTMYPSGDVRSGLCSGIQWDMVMKFVDGKYDANGNVFDVRTYNPERHSGSVAQTGKDNDDKVQNIYDLEGNCVEWVAEKNKTSHPFVTRGSSYTSTSDIRASSRFSVDDIATYLYSFRPALYIM